MQRRNFLSGGVALGVAGCTRQYERASWGEVRAAFYTHPGPNYISLLNMVPQESEDNSDHSALLINGSQRVLYDPAGGFKMEGVPRKGDMNYGVTDRVLYAYAAYHYHWKNLLVEQRVIVSQEIADLAIRKSEAYGETSRIMCAITVGQVLRSLPGFVDAPVHIFPSHLLSYFRSRPDVQEAILPVVADFQFASDDTIIAQ